MHWLIRLLVLLIVAAGNYVALMLILALVFMAGAVVGLGVALCGAGVSAVLSDPAGDQAEAGEAGAGV